MTGGSAETHLIVDFFSDSPLKNMMDGNLVFPVPPDDIIKKPAYTTLELQWGSGLSWRNGRWRTMGEWFQSVHIFLSAMLLFLERKNSDAYST